MTGCRIAELQFRFLFAGGALRRAEAELSKARQQLDMSWTAQMPPE